VLSPTMREEILALHENYPLPALEKLAKALLTTLAEVLQAQAVVTALDEPRARQACAAVQREQAALTTLLETTISQLFTRLDYLQHGDGMARLRDLCEQTESRYQPLYVRTWRPAGPPVSGVAESWVVAHTNYEVLSDEVLQQVLDEGVVEGQITPNDLLEACVQFDHLLRTRGYLTFESADALDGWPWSATFPTHTQV
jgi:hypothetical protein